MNPIKETEITNNHVCLMDFLSLDMIKNYLSVSLPPALIFLRDTSIYLITWFKYSFHIRLSTDMSLRARSPAVSLTTHVAAANMMEHYGANGVCGNLLYEKLAAKWFEL